MKKFLTATILQMLTFVGICGMFSLASCGNKTTAEASDSDSVFMLDGPSMEYNPTEHDQKMNDMIQERKAVVKRTEEIYKEVVKAYSSTDGYGADIDLDKMFCSDDWNKTVKATREKDKEFDGIGFFDADYWVMGNDLYEFDADNFKFEALDMDSTPRTASVLLDLHNCGNVSPVRVNLVFEHGEWKIDDLTDINFELDWKKSMKEYLAE